MKTEILYNTDRTRNRPEAVFEDFSDDDLGIEPEYSVEEIVEAENE